MTSYLVTSVTEYPGTLPDLFSYRGLSGEQVTMVTISLNFATSNGKSNEAARGRARLVSRVTRDVIFAGSHW
jgi:hypothetical protein